MTGEKEIPAAPARGRGLILLSALSAAYFLSNFFRLILGVVSADIGAEYNLSAARLGVLGSAFFYLYAAMQIPAGLVSNRAGGRLILSLSCLFTALATFWFAAAPGYGHLVFARGLTGLAVAFIYVPALTVLRKNFDDKVLGSMMGIFIAAGQTGAVSASLPLRLVSTALGWRPTFVIMVFFALLAALAIRLGVPPEKGKAAGAPSEKASWKQALNPGFLSVVVWFFIAGGTRMAFQALWGGVFFTGPLGFSEEQNSVLLMCISLGCIAGAMILGRLADRFGSLRTLVWSSYALAGLWALLLVSAGSFSPAGIGAFCFALGALGAGGFTVAFSCVREFSGRNNGGLLVGINNCSAFLGSAVVTQLCGALIGGLGQYPVPVRFSVLFSCFALSCLLISFAIAWFNRKAIAKSKMSLSEAK